MLAIAYIVGLFYFIRLWLKSWLLAAIGALLAIKMGMFYYGASLVFGSTPAIHSWRMAGIFFYFSGLWFVSC